ncbi:hypothetical protein [Zobellia laminariae]|uniref:hypothetical protein n=1 Tax=Zobellia laminariae TaxID=248906 RepID=UPI0026F465B7|nr:hypothetical protein [Zobellia laminariae]WKX76826.1 hypothetical protein Q5W13_01225 [Zobellia laminariae]
MKKTFIFCLLTILTIKMAYAHNPLSATYYLEVNQELGILNVSVSQAGFQEALNKHYPEINFDKLSDVEYKKLAVGYIKDNFNLMVNGNQVQLLNGGLKLGSHQTDLKFITSDLPHKFNNLAIKIDAFKENDHHQTIFTFSLHGVSNKVILTEKNDYAASVEFKNNKMIAKTEGFDTKYLWFFTAIPILIVGKKLFSSQKDSA